MAKADNGWMRTTPRDGSWRPSIWATAAAALVWPGVVTILAVADQKVQTAIAAVLYVLAVVMAARIGGAPAGVVSALLSFLALNFFFTEPVHTFAVGTPEDLVALFAFLVTAVVVGVLVSSLVDARAKAERRELETGVMGRLATRLLGGEPTEKVFKDFTEDLRDIFQLRACALTTSFSATETAKQEELGEPTDRFCLNAKDHDLGEITVWSVPGSKLTDDERSVVRSIASQFSIALEGMRLTGEVRKAELEAHSSQLKAALFSGVTHDVKTPLAAITASVTSLQEGRIDEAARTEHIQTIRQEADRLHRVVNNLLDVARLRAGALVVKKVPTPMDELMESVLNRLRPLLDGRPVDIRVGEDVPQVPMDVVQIDQVLSNLIENAIKFSPARAPISLLAVGSQHSVRVTVSDHGPGIPKEDRLRIFEPFERGDNSTSGTGLGLAISSAIVAAHGGRMWVSDNPSGGAAFTFELPCAPRELSGQEVTVAPTGPGR